MTPAQRTLFISSLTLSIAWIYQGIVPKILYPNTGEMEMLKSLGLFQGMETTILIFIGLAEAIFGVVIFFVRKKLVYVLNMIGLLFLGGGAMIGKPEIYSFPFNPFTLSISMMTLSMVCIINLEQNSGQKKSL